MVENESRIPKKTYIGSIDGGDHCHVNVFENDHDAGEIDLRSDLRDHSDEPAWGYGGSGPAQLALAILADATGDDQIAGLMYEDFKGTTIKPLDMDSPFNLSRADVVREVFRLLDELEDYSNGPRGRLLGREARDVLETQGERRERMLSLLDEDSRKEFE